MAELYYNQLNDEQRSKIQFVALNADDAATSFGDLEDSARYPRFCKPSPSKQCDILPAVQDDSGSPLMNALSNNNQYPKDDMAIVDKDGNMIQYFPSSKSNMGNKNSNQVRSAVMEIVREDFKNPCVKPSSGGDKGDGGDKGNNSGKGDGNSNDGEVSPLQALKAHCKLKDNCAACKGKLRKGDICTLKKRLKCKFMTTPKVCEMAKCKYKPAKGNKKARCVGKGIF